MCLHTYPLRLAALLLLATAVAAQPELSTGPGQSIAFDQSRGALVARGDAVLRDGPLLLRAGEIGFYQREQRAEAIGNVEVTRMGLRILSDRAEYLIPSRTFTADAFKAGAWPLFFEGDALTASPESIVFEHTTVYFGEPAPWNLRLHARQLEYTADGRLRANGARFGLGRLPLFSLPRYSGNLDRPPLRYSGRLGYRDRLGAYLQNEALLQAGDRLYAGANLDLYTRRGILLGPALRYDDGTDGQRLQGRVSAGFLRDTGVRGRDFLGRPIDRDRHFLQWQHYQRDDEGTELRAHLHWWSDSEVLRDFRGTQFYPHQNPDSFLEATLHPGPFIITLLTRVRPNDFQFVRERLPEIRVDLPPAPIGHAGLWHRGSLRFASLREKELVDRDGNRIRGYGDGRRSNRVDLQYGWILPVALQPGLQWTPRASARASHYFDSEDPAGSSYSRIIGEIGFDFDIAAHATWNLQNPVWQINGLRHSVRNRLQYRYLPHAAAGAGAIPALDVPVFSINRQPMNLMDERTMDRLADRHLVRLGTENSWQTRHREWGARELLNLNVYQDLLINPGTGQSALDSLWTELEVHPASWLEGALFTRVDASRPQLSDLRMRVSVRDADRWTASIGADYLRGRFEQYLFEYARAFTPQWHGDLLIRWDREQGRITEQVYALSQQVGRSLLLRYALRVRGGETREEGFQLSVSLNFLGF